MNIALFLDCFTPMKNGVITSVLQLKDGLEKRGHHVVIATVQVKGYENTDPNVIMFPLIPFDFGSKQGFGPARVNMKELINFLKEHKIDLIHSHTEFSLGKASRRAASKLKVPRVITNHTMWEQYGNYSFLLKIKPLFRAFLRHYFHRTSVIIAPSGKMEKYIRLVLPGMPVQIIPNGIDKNKFKPASISEQDFNTVRQMYGIKATDKLLIFVGRIGPEKRAEQLFDVVVPVVREDRNVKMIFVGDGPSAQHLQEKTKSLGLENSFIFTGFINWDGVFKLCSIASLFVTASVSETHPMTLIESAMCGLPSIARRDEAYQDLIQDDVNGYLVDTDEEMTRQIDMLIHDEARLKQFSRQALEIAQHFTADIHVARVESLYKQVLGLQPVQVVAN